MPRPLRPAIHPFTLFFPILFLRPLPCCRALDSAHYVYLIYAPHNTCPACRLVLFKTGAIESQIQGGMCCGYGPRLLLSPRAIRAMQQLLIVVCGCMRCLCKECASRLEGTRQYKLCIIDSSSATYLLWVYLVFSIARSLACICAAISNPLLLATKCNSDIWQPVRSIDVRAFRQPPPAAPHRDPPSHRTPPCPTLRQKREGSAGDNRFIRTHCLLSVLCGVATPTFEQFE